MSPFDSFVISADHIFTENGSMSRKQFRALLKQFEGERLYLARKEITKKEIHGFVRDRLLAGNDRRTICRRLCALYGVCENTAYGYINRALDVASNTGEAA